MSLFQALLGGGGGQAGDGGLFSAVNNPFRRAADGPAAQPQPAAAPEAPGAAAPGAGHAPPAVPLKAQKKAKRQKRDKAAAPAAEREPEATAVAEQPAAAQPKKKRKAAAETAAAAAAASEGEAAEEPAAAQPEKRKKQRAAGAAQAAAAPAATDARPDQPAPGQAPRKAKKRARTEADSAGPVNAGQDAAAAAAQPSAKQRLGQVRAAARAAKAAGAAAAAEPPQAPGGELLQDLSDAEGQPGGVAAERQRRTPEEEAEQLGRTVFVGNLPAAISRKALKALFSQYGTMESVRLRSVPIQLDKKLPRRAAVLAGRVAGDRGTAHAYVVFREAAAVGAALAHNMQEVEGLHIRVDRASRPSKDGAGSGVEYDRARSVFVGNLAFDIQDEDVIRFFNEAAGGADAVAAVRVVRDAETNIGKGFAFVLFGSSQGARMAAARDGAELRGRPVRVSRVSTSRRQQPPPAKGAAGATKGRPASGAVRRLAAKGAAPTGWQGIRTKGKDKVAGGGVAPKLPGVKPKSKAGGKGKGKGGPPKKPKKLVPGGRKPGGGKGRR